MLPEIRTQPDDQRLRRCECHNDPDKVGSPTPTNAISTHIATGGLDVRTDDPTCSARAPPRKSDSHAKIARQWSGSARYWVRVGASFGVLPRVQRECVVTAHSVRMFWPESRVPVESRIGSAASGPLRDEVLPSLLPCEVLSDQVVEFVTVEAAVQSPTRGDVADDQHTPAVPTQVQVIEETSDPPDC